MTDTIATYICLGCGEKFDRSPEEIEALEHHKPDPDDEYCDHCFQLAMLSPSKAGAH